MKRSTKINLGMYVGNAAIGWLAGTLLSAHVLPYCNGKADKALAIIGGTAVALTVNRQFSEMYLHDAEVACMAIDYLSELNKD